MDFKKKVDLAGKEAIKKGPIGISLNYEIE